MDPDDTGATRLRSNTLYVESYAGSSVPKYPPSTCFTSTQYGAVSGRLIGSGDHEGIHPYVGTPHDAGSAPMPPHEHLGIRLP